jgi:hypothetical protein
MKKFLDNLQSLLYGGVIGYFIFFVLLQWPEYKETFDIQSSVFLGLRHLIVAACLLLSFIKLVFMKSSRFYISAGLFVIAVVNMVIYLFAKIQNPSYEETLFEEFFFEFLCIFFAGAVVTLFSAFFYKLNIGRRPPINSGDTH